jgi:hypothetical protein
LERLAMVLRRLLGSFTSAPNSVRPSGFAQ